MTVLLSEMSIFCVRAGCKLWLESYGSKHASWSLSKKLFVHTNMYNLKLQVIYGHCASWTSALLSEIFLVCIRVTWEIWLESSGTRHISVILWYNIVCIVWARTFVAICCATVYDNQTNVPYDCLLHTNRQLYCQQLTYRFIRALLTNYTTCCSVFSVNSVC